MVPFNSTYIAVALPIILLYLLVIIRVAERRRKSSEGIFSLGSFVSIRDAGLMTLALDASEIASNLGPFIYNKESSISLMIAAVLLFVHLSIFLLSNKLIRNRELNFQYSRSNFSRNALDTYIAFSLLITNAMTIVLVIQAVGK
jgi:hypothetical protein